MAQTFTRESYDLDLLLDSIEVHPYRLIVHNDEINTFDWVIDSLIDVCKHTRLQAEQCAYIIHYKGKYTVKEGEENLLLGMRSALVERGIGATVEG
ncbi:MAG: ATP-dependent Clp protease adaptor ClpS [Chitinophagales bacterium]|jgi:ATP-dependent Clp protease adaptor protein ClpS|nr:ATP-dependent Clp protease adaptor ClpS [Chitinophagales bacterium]HNI43092.1 ATP-dependent Clp protease adaptor ClpS [Chitinophagales bacterium]